MLKVLLVDDMDIIRRQVKRLKLWGENSGFIISAEARNGHEALAKLADSPVDLVITDIKMPKIDGLELLAKIMNDKLCPCVVLMSDYSDFDYVRQGLILGAFDYMKKPIDEREFNKVLLRAKDVIMDRKREQERLHENLGEQAEEFLYETGIRQISELIGDEEKKVMDVASDTADKIGKVLCYDLIKVESVFNNTLSEIVKAVFENYKWLARFLDGSEINYIDFSQGKEFEAVKASFIHAVKSFNEYLNKLQNGLHKTDLIGQVSLYVLENIDEDISLKTVADGLFINKTYLSEAFKQKTGVSFIGYITMIKMERAQKLIREGNLKVYEISDRLGFKDVEYFSKLFKKHMGVTPSEYRQNMLNRN